MSALMKKMKSVLSFKNPPVKFESSSTSENQSSSTQKITKTPSKLDLRNINEISYSNIEQSLQNWDMPIIDTKQIYTQGSFAKHQDFIIKLEEDTKYIDDEGQELFIPPDKISRYKEIYKYLHIGLIQVAIKPLTTLRLNTSVLASVRDKRHLDFNDSLFEIIEGSLAEGPIFFNCFPNFTLSLHD
ncbi:hypothetical protein Scep_029393 [Stephania cephalantha]|uniref:Uncharacterized protein n=1 Tax=Stephania cephalantha TaxID=152367 RepID=A0AAP0E225_9MAGN